MINTKKQLREWWDTEKEGYRTKELGGSQVFVKKVLMSSQILNLKEGKITKNSESRKNEFLEETTKKSKRADIIIFIDSERIIPVEVERYGNIKAGEWQLFNYQRVWDKKWGLLTDGYEWIFYLGKIQIKKFTIDSILDDTETFLNFWNEYTQPINYYINFFQEYGQLSIFEEDLNISENRQNFYIDITTLIKNFTNKLNIEGYFDTIEKKQREKQAIEISYAYLIQFFLYKTLVDNEFSTFTNDFKQCIYSIIRNLQNERYIEILNSVQEISNLISKDIYRPFKDEQLHINEKLKIKIENSTPKLSDISPWLDIFIFIKRYNFANIRNEIFGFIYENYLKQLYAQEQRGQYFTDPIVVDFMLEQIGYTKENLKQKIEKHKTDEISIIDPSCGSGTFLYSSVRNIIESQNAERLDYAKKTNEIINQNVFGLDIEEFPLYLAEMSILMRMLPLIINEKYNNPLEKKIKVFKTNDSISEFLDTALRNTMNDVKRQMDKNKGQTSLFKDDLNLGYVSYVRNKDDLNDLKSSLENNQRISRYRFDYVIGNPPYITYNECSKQNVLITKLIQSKKVQMSDIYGVNLNTVPDRMKAYAPKPNLYSFFIALGLALLKDDGKLCYIIPQTVLTATDLDVIRYHLAKYTTIEKIININANMFISRGLEQDTTISTSSLIFVVSKKTHSPSHQVEIINYKNAHDNIQTCIENIRTGKKIDKFEVSQKKLLKEIANWNFIKYDATTQFLFEKYNKLEKFDIYRFDNFSKKMFDASFYFDKGLVFPKDKIYSINNELERAKKEKFFYLTQSHSDKYEIPTTEKIIFSNDIVFPKGAQGFKVYNEKYKIIWRYMNPDKFYFSENNIMISFNWVIISSNNKNEILYFLSVLNSKLNNFIFSSLLKSENEKSLSIGIKSIKEFGRIPIINDENKHIKQEIITKTQELLDIEKAKLSDFVDFTNVIMQKFDNFYIKDDLLVLQNKNKNIECKIKKNTKLVSKIIENNKVKVSNKLFESEEKTTLSFLKNIPCYDSEYQKQIKNYVDDLVFCLYFDLKIENVDFKYCKDIHNICTNEKIYRQIET